MPPSFVPARTAESSKSSVTHRLRVFPREPPAWHGGCDHADSGGGRKLSSVLRVTRIRETDSSVTLKVEGEVAARSSKVIESECLQHLNTQRELELDFADVTYVDVQGAEAVRRLEAAGVRLINCRPLILEWIRG